MSPSACAGVEKQTKQPNVIFIDCNLFIVPRNRLVASLPTVPITLDTLLYSHDLLAFETNKELHKTVFQFIKDMDRYKTRNTKQIRK